MPTSIALLDAGFDLSHPGLQHLDQAGQKWWVARTDFTFANSGSDAVTETLPEDKPHGTHMSSMIAGKSSAQGTPNRFAPDDAVLQLIKTTQNDAEPFTEFFLKGVATAIQLKVDVIAVAYWPVWQGDPHQDQIDDAFDAIRRAGILVVAPLANSDNFARFNRLRFPASMPNVIVCGVATDAFLQSYNNEQFDNRIDFLLPQAPVTVCPQGNNPCETKTIDSSLSVAVLAGLIATQIQAWKTAEGAQYRRRSHDEMVTALRTQAKPFSVPTMLADQTVQLYFIAPRA